MAKKVFCNQKNLKRFNFLKTLFFVDTSKLHFIDLENLNCFKISTNKANNKKKLKLNSFMLLDILAFILHTVIRR